MHNVKIILDNLIHAMLCYKYCLSITDGFLINIFDNFHNLDMNF